MDEEAATKVLGERGVEVSSSARLRRGAMTLRNSAKRVASESSLLLALTTGCSTDGGEEGESLRRFLDRGASAVWRSKAKGQHSPSSLL